MRGAIEVVEEALTAGLGVVLSGYGVHGESQDGDARRCRDAEAIESDEEGIWTFAGGWVTDGGAEGYGFAVLGAFYC
jgi:hypothetical protein